MNKNITAKQWLGIARRHARIQAKTYGQVTLENLRHLFDVSAELPDPPNAGGWNQVFRTGDWIKIGTHTSNNTGRLANVYRLRNMSELKGPSK